MQTIREQRRQSRFFRDSRIARVSLAGPNGVLVKQRCGGATTLAVAEHDRIYGALTAVAESLKTRSRCSIASAAGPALRTGDHSQP
jgi:hypothetical protein